MSVDTKKQVSQIYNEIPELTYAEIQVKGKEEDHFDRSLSYQLTKRRSNALLNYLREIGISVKHLKMMFKTEVSILLFKPKGELFLTERIASKEMDLKTEFAQSLTVSDDVFLSHNACSYQLVKSSTYSAESRFEPSNSRFKVCEALGSKGAADFGWIGSSDLQLFRVLLTTNVKIEKVGEAGERSLRTGEKIRISLPVEKKVGQVLVQKGKLVEGQLHWSTEKNIVVFERVGAEEGKSPRYLQTELLDTGFFRIVELVPAKELVKHINITAKGQGELQVYAYSADLDVVIPAYQHSNYFNRYEFLYLDNSCTWTILTVDLNRSKASYSAQQFEKGSLSNNSVLLVETKECQYSNSKRCWPWN